MANINKNIIMQAGAAVANAANKAAGLSAATPEPGSIISVIQLVNGGRTIGPDALAHFTESVRNKLLSLLVSMEPIQSGSGTPSPDNVRPISGRTGLNVYVSPTTAQVDATTYPVDWTTQAGTVYGGTLDVVTGVLTVDRASVDMGTLTWAAAGTYYYRANLQGARAGVIGAICSSREVVYPTRSSLKNNYQLAPYNNENQYICALIGNYATAADFKAAMSGVQLVYELATPITYQLSAQDVITLVGYNYIWSDGGDVTITE